MQTPQKKERFYYLDNLKVALTVLVIIHHAFIAYGGEGAFVIYAKTSAGDVFNIILTGFRVNY